VIYSGPGSGKSFLGLRGSPILSTVSGVKMKMSGMRWLKMAADRPSPPKMKKFWGTMKNPRERTMAESLATGGESLGNMLADEF
jgi:hypothetical protein